MGFAGSRFGNLGTRISPRPLLTDELTAQKNQFETFIC
jgi:hypothetical protein